MRAARPDPILGRCEWRAALGLIVVYVWKLHRQVTVGNRDDAAALAVHDWYGTAPVALARDEPVAELVADRRVALPFAIEPTDDRFLALDCVH